jgi:uncharacterized protein (TIGR04255 family)
MGERKAPRIQLANSPLVYVLAQARFSPVLRMDEYVPTIQEALRRSGFPRYREERVSELIVLPQQSVSHGMRWVFGSKDQREAVVLTENFVVLEVSTYAMFEQFVERIGQVLEILASVVQPDLCERVGLRYVDLLAPGEDAPTLNDLLQPGLRGLESEGLGIERDSFRYEIRGTTGDGTLVVRLVEGPTYLPPDIVTQDLGFEVPLSDKYVFLDMDHYTETPSDFEREVITRSLWRMHDHVDRAFRQAVTAQAFEYWSRSVDDADND